MPSPRTTDAKVCIVDDDSSILETLKGLLASEKIVSVTFDDSERFLNHVQAHDIRVAILDVAMPGLSGLQLQKRLYRFSPATKVIIMTGRPDADYQSQSLLALDLQ